MTLSKFTQGDRARRRKAQRRRDEAAHVAIVRAQVVERERGLCRVMLDGFAAAREWCTSRGTDFHEGSGARGMGGRCKDTRPVTTANSLFVCHDCHMAHHQGRFAIDIDDADSPLGVFYRLLTSRAVGS